MYVGTKIAVKILKLADLQWNIYQFHGCFYDFDEIILKTTKLLELFYLRKIGPCFVKRTPIVAASAARLIL